MMDVHTVYTAAVDTGVGGVGTLRLASTDAGLLYVELPKHTGRGLQGFLRQHARGALVREGYAPNKEAARQIIEYVHGKRKEFELALDLRGTLFQLEVWDALRRIPYGEIRSYEQIAQTLGRGDATRAVGTANAANPVMLFP